MALSHLDCSPNPGTPSPRVGEGWGEGGTGPFQRPVNPQGDSPTPGEEMTFLQPPMLPRTLVPRGD